jgi:hypothetical protein
MWISNGGRHYPPWNGRHVNVMGLEEVTSYFHIGLAASAKSNPFTARGIPTTLLLHPARPTVVSTIMAVAAIPAGFTKVNRIEREAKGCTLISENGKQAKAALDLDFLQ